jgi:carbamoyltransferase
MSLILGISGGFIPRVQNPAACLIINGKLEFAQEEERINRVKNSRGLMPTNAIKEALNFKKLKINNIDFVAYSSKHLKLIDKIKSYFNFTFGYCPKIIPIDHHTCHAYSTFYPSGFSKANIITADFSGDGVSTTINIGDESGIKRVKEFKKPNSLGIFYGLVTQAIGFELDNDEYKVMGLASYGNPKYNLNKILKIDKNGYKLNKKIINSEELNKVSSLYLSRQEPFYSNYLLKNLGINKRILKITDKKKIDLAASAQYQLNLAAESLFKWTYKKTKINNFCLAGGVALNCTMNKHLSNLDFVNNFYVQPASSDAGNALGAAIYVAKKLKEKLFFRDNVYLGNSFKNSQIKKILKNNNLYKSAIKFDKRYIAKQLANSKVVAIFQGSHEFGPRALGNRSILANPKNPKMKNILNKKIKYREKFRPFAPVVLKQHANKYFKIIKGVDYTTMTVTCDVKKGVKKILPSCVHFDNTSRVQVLEHGKNKKIGDILIEFGKLTGDPVLINTSFNINKEPNVNTIENAISTFFSSGIDYLILEDYILSK